MMRLIAAAAASKPEGFQFALPEPQMLAQSKLDRDQSQRVGVDQGGPPARQHALIGVRMRIV
jgi:hypothetical protein